MKRLAASLLLGFALLTACSQGNSVELPTTSNASSSIPMQWPLIQNVASVPDVFSYEHGREISPELACYILNTQLLEGLKIEDERQSFTIIEYKDLWISCEPYNFELFPPVSEDLEYDEIWYVSGSVEIRYHGMSTPQDPSGEPRDEIFTVVSLGYRVLTRVGNAYRLQPYPA